MEPKTSAYQIAVELERPLMENNGVPYREFLRAIAPSRTGIPGMPRIVGDYSEATHVFFGAATRADVDRSSEAAQEIGLVKAVHVDEF